MSIARETDLPDLLSHLGYSVRQIGSYYTTNIMQIGNCTTMDENEVRILLQ